MVTKRKINDCVLPEKINTSFPTPAHPPECGDGGGGGGGVDIFLGQHIIKVYNFLLVVLLQGLL